MWVNLIIGLILTAIGFLLRPKPEPPKPNTLDDFDVPVTKEGAEVGKVYGTVWIDAPQIVWYGDFKAEAIKKKEPKK
jgi:hypothetical protein